MGTTRPPDEGRALSARAGQRRGGEVAVRIDVPACAVTKFFSNQSTLNMNTSRASRMKLIHVTLVSLASLLLAACGGGGDDVSSASQTNGLTSASTTVCGLVVGPNLLEGTVVSVHDGDTLTLKASGSEYQIRLDGIDAPELAQAFGNTSQVALASAVLNRTVTVAYAKQDQYGRIVGAVFQGCNFVNLGQVSIGMAWFYKAYQCELSQQVRSLLAATHQNAVDARVGLWTQDNPEAPWFFRNGVEPVTPTCTSSLPVWLQTSALTQTGATTSGGSSTTISGGGSTTVSGGGSASTTDPTKICYTGPRGGTYTITANGNKNYSGC